MSQTCPSCGYQNPDGARFCTRCGASLKDMGAQQNTGYAPVPPQAQGYTPPPPPPTGIPQPTAYTQADIDGLRNLKNYGLLGLIGIVISFIVTLFLFGLNFSVATGIGFNGQPPPNVGIVAVGAYLVVLVIGVVIAILAFIFLYRGFVSISRVDGSLRTPARLLLLIPVGLVIITVSFILILGSLIVAPIATPPMQSANTPTVLAVFGSILIFVSVILLLVGVIGGEILGLWKVGSRYGESLIQIGGILLILPLINIVAPILVYIGSNSALTRIVNKTNAVNTPQQPPAGTL